MACTAAESWIGGAAWCRACHGPQPEVSMATHQEVSPYLLHGLSLSGGGRAKPPQRKGIGLGQNDSRSARRGSVFLSLIDFHGPQSEVIRDIYQEDSLYLLQGLSGRTLAKPSHHRGNRFDRMTAEAQGGVSLLAATVEMIRATHQEASLLHGLFVRTFAKSSTNSAQRVKFARVERGAQSVSSSIE